jgi:hypothetical protein
MSTPVIAAAVFRGPWWHNLWPFAKTWEGYLAATVTTVLAVFYGNKKMIETYEWYMYRYYDRKVEDCLRASVSSELLTQHGPRRWTIPKSLGDISRDTGFSNRRVSACLKRLLRKRLVLADGEKWKIEATGRG